jgi:hypothetical protein
MKWIHNSSSLAVVDDEDGDDDGDENDGDDGDKSGASRVRLLVPLGESPHHMLPSPSSSDVTTSYCTT